MNDCQYCCGCLSSERQLFVPSKSLIITYQLLLTCNQMKSDQMVPENCILLCVACCHELHQIQQFQNSCRNASQELLSRKLLHENAKVRMSIDDSLHELMRENVKIEKLSNEAPFLDFPEVQVFVQELKQEEETIPVVSITPRKEYCRLCDKYFLKVSNDNAFASHITLVHSTKKGKYFCNHCEGSYNQVGNFRRHFRECHMTENKLIMCQFCPETFYRKPLFYKHVKTVHTSLAYICDLCKNEFHQKYNLRKHMLTHIQKSVCRNCNRTFNDKKEYTSHRKGCGERYMCHFCSCVLLSKYSLENHIKQKHLPSPPCDICGQQFHRRMDLEHHKKIEHSSKTKVCEQCGKSFFTQHGLDSHIKYTHEKMQNEYTKKRFWCEICNKFESHTTKNAHVLKSKYGKRFKCELCDLAFFTRQALNRHSHVHTKTRPFNCKLCDKGYYNIQYLKAHYERTHGSEYLGAIKK